MISVLKKVLFGLGILLCLTTSAFAETTEDLYTFRLGKAFVSDTLPNVATIRFYTPASVLNWIPVVRDMGISAGVTLNEKKMYLLGLSYQLNSIVDLNGGYAFAEGTQPKLYGAVSLDVSVFNQLIDMLQKVVQ